MPTIHCKLEDNALTVPRSYRIRFVPNNNLGTEDIAAEMCAIAPILTPGVARTAMSAYHQAIQKQMINGNHVAVDDSLIYTLSFTGRLDNPDDPLPPIAESLHMQVHPTASFMKEIHYQAKLERMDMTEKLPQISQVEDTTLQLDDVLSSNDVIRLSGENLDFDPRLNNGECVISGTRSGTAIQTQFGPISDTNIILIPTIPTQDDPWNNEYTLSLSVRYTGHGTLRTGTYRRRLRTPLLIEGLSPETGAGILTGSATIPYVRVTDAIMSGDARLRIQVLQDLAENRLFFSLLALQEDGAKGTEVAVTENGDYTLPGFAGSAVAQLMITVDSYTDLWDMIRNDYSGRLIDMLDMKVGG